MNEVNKTLYIPLYGKSYVSKLNMILKDPMAEKIWAEESFPLKRKSKSKWLTYNMAMRARVFDDWTDAMLAENKEAVVIHIGCGLDSRYLRVKRKYEKWADCDLPEVISVREKYFTKSDTYEMISVDATDPEQISKLPDGDTAIVILEGLCMYLTNEQVHGLLQALKDKYASLHILMDVYTEFGARASKIKNPISEVGVTEVYGIDNIEDIIGNLDIRLKSEHSFTPENLIKELPESDQRVFRLLYTGSLYGKIYRLFELEA
ncbi:MAG: class I SAM-dependent methyltransferase [Erysipelotrichaceae bacterium]|nr:class I SAM-dependent methyltransferase [Erysipelotrichaceae bacterium]